MEETILETSVYFTIQSADADDNAGITCVHYIVRIATGYPRLCMKHTFYCR